MGAKLAHWFIHLSRRTKAVILISADFVFTLIALKEYMEASEAERCTTTPA